MLRILGIVVAVLVVLAAGGAWYVYGLVRDLEVEQVTDDVWVIPITRTGTRPSCPARA